MSVSKLPHMDGSSLTFIVPCPAATAAPILTTSTSAPTRTNASGPWGITLANLFHFQFSILFPIPTPTLTPSLPITHMSVISHTATNPFPPQLHPWHPGSAGPDGRFRYGLPLNPAQPPFYSPWTHWYCSILVHFLSIQQKTVCYL